MVNVLINLLARTDNFACVFNDIHRLVKGCKIIYEEMSKWGLAVRAEKWEEVQRRSYVFLLCLNLKILKIPTFN